MKLTIWVITVIGILPILLLSAIQVHLQVIHKHQLFSHEKTQEKPDFVLVSFKPAPGIGHFKHQELKLTHMIWPALVSLLGIALVFVGLFFLIPKQASVVEAGGSKELNRHVKKLLGSRASFASLGIFTLDGQKGFSLWKKDGLVTAQLSAEIIPDDGKEERIVAFFEDLGITAISDYKARNGGIEDSVRLFSYPIEANNDRVSEICVRIMKEIYNISEQDGLKYHLEKD
jgi:hypothetical protein